MRVYREALMRELNGFFLDAGRSTGVHPLFLLVYLTMYLKSV